MWGSLSNIRGIFAANELTIDIDYDDENNKIMLWKDEKNSTEI
jgi:hypothetical protein